MDWEDLFQPQIIERGLGYYQQGAVTDFQQTATEISATVLGTQAYQATVQRDDDEGETADCTCPYAADGKPCKHEAAVLFYWDKGGETATDESSTKLSELVAGATEQQVRDFLTQVLTADGRLAQQFKMQITPAAGTNDLSLYRQQISAIFQAHTDRHHFIDYYAADGFGQDLDNFLLTDVQAIITGGQLNLAFKVVNVVALKVSQVDIDDSDGEVTMLVQTCGEVWTQLIQLADAKLRHQMFTWFKKHADGSLDAFDEILVDLLMANFSEEKYLREKLDWVDQKIQQIQDAKDDWISAYSGNDWAMARLQLMDEPHLDSAEIEAFAQANLKFTEVRKFLIARRLQQKDYTQAIQLLRAGKQQGQKQHFWGVVSEFSQQLKDIYRKTGQPEAYRQELWNLLTGPEAANVALYRELKGLVGQTQWPAERKRLFEAMPQNVDLKPLYVADELYPQLLKAVLAAPNLYGVETYEDVLKPLYPGQLLRKYVEMAKEMAQQTGTRSHYREIVAVLNQMATYRGGSAVATDLIEKWRQAYPRRTAMLDELRRFDGSPS